MKKNGKWLVALDFSQVDKDIFWSLNALKKRLDPSEITFVHVIRSKAGLELLIEDLTGQMLVMREERRLELQSWVDELIEGDSSDYEYKILQGDPFQEINRLANKINPDLVIAGIKDTSDHRSITARLRGSQTDRCLFVLENKEEVLIDQI